MDDTLTTSLIGGSQPESADEVASAATEGLPGEAALNQPPPEIVFRSPFPRPAAGALRNIIATLLVGAAIAAIVLYFDKPASTGDSQSITLTAAATGPAPKVGKPAPDFQVRTLDGATHQLSEFRGQPVWINFWASWCPPCRAENPDIQDVYAANQAKGLVVLAIAIGEDDGDVRSYAERTQLTYDIGLDSSTGIAAAYRIVGIPTHFFIDRDGIIREWRIGSMNKSTMEKKVATIMGDSQEAD